MKRLFWMGLIALSMMLVAAAPRLPPTPDPYPGPTSYPGLATNTPIPTPTGMPVPTETPVCEDCQPTAVLLTHMETRTKADTIPAWWLLVAAAFLILVYRQQKQ